MRKAEVHRTSDPDWVPTFNLGPPSDSSGLKQPPTALDVNGRSTSELDIRCSCCAIHQSLLTRAAGVCILKPRTRVSDRGGVATLHSCAVRDLRRVVSGLMCQSGNPTSTAYSTEVQRCIPRQPRTTKCVQVIGLEHPVSFPRNALPPLDFRVLSPADTSNSTPMDASTTPLMDCAMHTPPPAPDKAAPRLDRLHGNAVSPSFASAEPPAKTDSIKQPSPAMESDVCAALAQVVLTAQIRRRQAEQLTDAAAQALQSRNAHD